MASRLLGALVLSETVRILLSYQAFHSGANVSSSLLACLVEVTKLAVAIVAVARGSGGVRQLVLHKFGEPPLRKALGYIGFFVPALLYLVNNVLYLVGLHLGEPALLQAFVMSKLPLTAIVHHLALRPQENKLAWAALGVIALGLGETAVPSIRDVSTSSAGSSSTSTLRAPILGLIIGLNSATASIWTEKMLKRDASFWVAQVRPVTDRSAPTSSVDGYLAQFYLYLFGASLAAFLAFVWDGQIHLEAFHHVTIADPNPEDIDRLTLLYYLVLVPLTAGVGFVVATILRQRDNLVKLVGSSACIVTVFVAQASLYPKLRQHTLNPHSICGIVLLAVGTYAFNHCNDSRSTPVPQLPSNGYLSIPTTTNSRGEMVRRTS
ncbi:uncharacterized protein JCM10292_007084 [Rhodotorula paludigena]|uniref:uncharacterized protein n=1 Tax=Rhodotorula paludigena TaxID=86838 RepID=UPI003179BE17